MRITVETDDGQVVANFDPSEWNFEMPYVREFFLNCLLSACKTAELMEAALEILKPIE